MKHFGAVWLIFALCVALAAGGMVRLGTLALDLERAEARARAQAELEENLQLALWRMDSALAPLMAEESARPHFAYIPLFPAERAVTCMFAEIQKGDVLMPSSLLTFQSPRIRLHFQFGPDGQLSSPQVPAGNIRDLAESRYLSPERIERATHRLHELGKLITNDVLAAAIPAAESAIALNNDLKGLEPTSNSRSSQEYLMRSRSTKLAQNAVAAEPIPLVAARSTVQQGPLTVVWIGPALILARRVHVEEGTFIQGCWLNWEVIRRELLDSVADLLPDATLQPVPNLGSQPATRMLASLPARLVPGVISPATREAWSPIRLALWIAWTFLSLAAVAIGLVLGGALSLSERRGTFVSAVTHELRTPLTTFRLYTEMLDEGMVASGESQRNYMKTLRSEADRLGHLVENVLSFARLERGRATDGREIVDADALLERLVPRLAARASQAGMKLVVSPASDEPQVRVDISVVDQILLNLVDNSVKYAANASDRRIHLDLSPADRWLAITVRDHGPGLPPRALARLFRPFSKSAHDAAQTAPGVGLGLALSRRLARTLGGDLRLHENGPSGASFSLTIPLA